MIIDVHHPLGGGRRLTVDGLEVSDGETLVVFGPNGAGKTTLLRLLAGTLPGGPAWHATYLPQRPAALRGTARRNLLLGLQTEEAAIATELAGELGLSRLLEARARSLSGGERQRLALARTLAVDRAVVLLDEPLAPIAAADRRGVTALVEASLGSRTAVLVTHERQVAAALGDRVAVLIDGSIHQVAPPAEVFARPATGDAATAVGIANVLEGEVTESGDGLIALKVGPLVVWGTGAEPVVGRAVFGGEAVTVFKGYHPDSGSARNTWTGTISELRPVGGLSELVVDCGPTIVALVTPGGLAGLDAAVGHTVTVAVKATAVTVL